MQNRVFEPALADKAAGIDVDDRERLGVVKQQIATRRQVDAALERALDRLIDAVAAQQLGLSRVALDALGELRTALLHVRDDAVVHLLVVDDQLVDVLAKVVANEAEGDVDLGVDQTRGLSCLTRSRRRSRSPSGRRLETPPPSPSGT